jgi:ABC-2 type transport system permease protein
LIAGRRILVLLINRDLKVKYSDSALGYLWTVLDPLMMALVYWFVFNVIFHRSGKAIAGSPYLLYLLCAMMPWQWASACLTGACRTLSGEAVLIRSVDVPREFWLIRMIGSNFVNFLFAIPVIGVFALAFGKPLHWQVIFVPVAMAMQWAALMGIGLILAPAAVLIPDIERVMRVATRVLTYMCPVIYGAFAVFDSVKIPWAVKQIYAWNPFTSILSMYRLSYFPNREDLHFTVVLRGGLSCIVLLMIGSYVFRRLEPEVLKEI